MSTRKGLSREKREQREHRVARLREDVKAKEGRDQEQRGRKGMGRTGNEKKEQGERRKGGPRARSWRCLVQSYEEEV